MTVIVAKEHSASRLLPPAYDAWILRLIGITSGTPPLFSTMFQLFEHVDHVYLSIRHLRVCKCLKTGLETILYRHAFI